MIFMLSDSRKGKKYHGMLNSASIDMKLLSKKPSLFLHGDSQYKNGQDFLEKTLSINNTNNLPQLRRGCTLVPGNTVLRGELLPKKTYMYICI